MEEEWKGETLSPGFQEGRDGRYDSLATYMVIDHLSVFIKNYVTPASHWQENGGKMA